MANTQVTVAARKVGETWEAVLLQDGKFMRAFQGLVGGSLNGLVGPALTTYLMVERNEGTEIGVNISVNEPDAN